MDNRERPVREQAADWYVRLEGTSGVGEAERARFVDWLRRSPVHVEEFLRVGGVRGTLAALPADCVPDVHKLVAEARGNVVGLDCAGTARSAPAPGVRKRRARWYVGAAAAVAVVVASVYLLTPSANAPSVNAPSAFVTALGEQRSILLSDGSVVELNTATRIEVAYTATERLIRLLAGEAVFEVASGRARPLRVLAGPAEVVALGTRFNVYRQEAQTVVTVVEGRVSVSHVGLSAEAARAPQGGRVVEVWQGNQVTVGATGPVAAPSAVDVLATTAWRDRRLVFDGTSLGNAIREINRYNHRKLQLADEALSGQRISGVFAANQPEAMVVFLEAVGEMQFEETERGWLIRSASPEARHDAVPPAQGEGA